METYAEQNARVVAYLSAEFLPGPHLANNLLNLGITEQTRQAMSEVGLNLDNLMEQEEEPVLATAVSAGWLPVTWTRSRRLKCPPSVTAYATSSAFLTRPSRTAGRWKSPTNGFATATLGKSCDPKSSTTSNSRAHRNVDRHQGRYRVLGSRQRRPGCGLRHPHPRLPGGHLQSVPPLESGGSRILRFHLLQSRRLLPRSPGKMHSENITKVLYPNHEVFRARRSGCNSNSFRLPPATGHDSRAFGVEAVARKNFTKNGLCNSTTPTPPSPSPN